MSWKNVDHLVLELLMTCTQLSIRVRTVLPNKLLNTLYPILLGLPDTSTWCSIVFVFKQNSSTDTMAIIKSYSTVCCLSLWVFAFANFQFGAIDPITRLLVFGIGYGSR